MTASDWSLFSVIKKGQMSIKISLQRKPIARCSPRDCWIFIVKELSLLTFVSCQPVVTLEP